MRGRNVHKDNRVHRMLYEGMSRRQVADVDGRCKSQIHNIARRDQVIIERLGEALVRISHIARHRVPRWFRPGHEPCPLCHCPWPESGRCACSHGPTDARDPPSEAPISVGLEWIEDLRDVLPAVVRRDRRQRWSYQQVLDAEMRSVSTSEPGIAATTVSAQRKAGAGTYVCIR